MSTNNHYIKFLAGSLIFAVLLFRCESLFDDSSKFPGCVGIKNSFDPNMIVDPYSVILGGKDTLNVQMIFTNYLPGSILSYTNFKMYTSSSNATGNLKYFYGDCTKNSSGEWNGSSALYYNGQYVKCDFDFDKFTCTKVSGLCKVYLPPVPGNIYENIVYIVSNPANYKITDTLYYNFAGLKL